MGQSASSDLPQFSSVVIGSGNNFAEAAAALELNLRAIYSDGYSVKRLLVKYSDLLRVGLLSDDYDVLHPTKNLRISVVFLYNDRNQLYTAYVQL